MSSLIAFLLVAPIVVEGRNDTIIHGWVGEPSGRGTWSLLWSCLATIFLCTWSVLHLDVPKKHGTFYLLSRKTRWMLYTALAPEMTLAIALEQFFIARFLLKTLLRDSTYAWTLTHTRFAFSDGFITHTLQTHQEQPCKPYVLWNLAENNRIAGSLISKEELSDHGKTDGVIKLVAVLQITWFGLQTLVRAIQHYQITALEILTTAFVFCSFLIYGFCWNKPQDVGYPVVIEILEPEVWGPGTATKNSKERPTSVAHARLEAQEARLDFKRKEVEKSVGNTIPGMVFVLCGCGFGAIHCLAWNSPFPTFAEKLAWRICSVVTTALPPANFLAVLLSGELEDACHLHRINPVLAVLTVSALICYAIGRITLIILAFMALRALPADAYQTVNWNNYFPHFAA